MRVLMLMVMAAGLMLGTPAMYGPGVKAPAANQYDRKIAPDPWSFDFDDILLWIKGLVWGNSAPQSAISKRP